MIKIQIFGSTIDDAVEELLLYKRIGRSVYCDFNGHILYSDTVTLDGAYLEITGMTRSDFLEAKKRHLEEWKKREEAEKEQAKALKPEWIARGRKFIPEALWAEWERCIDIRISDLYNGREIDNALCIVEAHLAGTPTSEIVQMIYDQGHSGMSYSMLKSIIKYFYPHGEQLFSETEAYEEAKRQEAASKKHQ